MTLWVILATGPSMNQALADSVRGKARVIAVSDSYKLAPWADALVSHDRSWWRVHSRALKFAGEKFCRFRLPGTRLFNTDVPSGCNSGLMAMYVAASRDLWGDQAATAIVLLGFDMHGTHFFGAHPPALKNTKPGRRLKHMRQFELWQGCRVVNCTAGSHLKAFPLVDLKDMIPA